MTKYIVTFMMDCNGKEAVMTLPYQYQSRRQALKQAKICKCDPHTFLIWIDRVENGEKVTIYTEHISTRQPKPGQKLYHLRCSVFRYNNIERIIDANSCLIVHDIVGNTAGKVFADMDILRRTYNSDDYGNLELMEVWETAVPIVG